MKKISIAFVATLSLMAFAGCKKKGSDIVAMKDDICKCKDAKCVEDVQKKYAKPSDDKGEVKPPTDDEAKAIKEMGECMQKIMTAGAGGGGGGDMKGGDMKGGDMKGGDDKGAGGGDKKDDKAAGGGGGGDAASTGVKECDDVIAAYQKYFECDKLKAAGDAAMKAQHDALDAMKQGWAQLKDAPQASKDAAATGCKQALDGMKKGAEAMGCKLD